MIFQEKCLWRAKKHGNIPFLGPTGDIFSEKPLTTGSEPCGLGPPAILIQSPTGFS
jgi:hypothetical protein